MEPSRQFRLWSVLYLSVVSFLLDGACCEYVTGTFEFLNSGFSCDVIDTRSSVSCGDCALACIRAQNNDVDTCSTFTCDRVTRTCNLCRNATALDTLGSPVFQLKVHGVFDTVSVGGRQFSIFISNTLRTKEKARQYCKDLGGDLLLIDSLEKYDAVAKVSRGPDIDYSIIDGNDVVTENKWVTDRDGTDVNPSIWLWAISEPNGNVGENCAAIAFASMKIVDFPCNSQFTFVCERKFSIHD